MLIFSWNVAGLSKTIQRIHETSPPGSGGKKNSNNHSIDAFFQRHHADIVCLQEHKIPSTQLKNRSEPRQCSTLENYESFWSCCSVNAAVAMNFGVVTYCRRGSVLRANSAPLDCPDLDAQGRCLMTDHGSFVLFNVYVPANGGQSLAFKMRFLRALERAMERQRHERKVPVILVGDLNIALDSKDIYWKDRVVDVDQVLQSINDQANEPVEREVLPRWKQDIRAHWSTIQRVLETKHVLPTKTTNTHTGEQFDKYRLAVNVGDRRVFLGRNEATPESCLCSFNFEEESTYFDEELQEHILAQKSNAVRLHVLAELMARIVDVEWSEATLREIATTVATVHQLSPPRRWLRNLLTNGNMVDAFRYFYPTAEARFTCWNQSTNRRYVNDGGRIDATLVDREMVPHVKKGNIESLRCGAPDVKLDDPLCEQAALEAATANGRFRPVSFEGGGIQEVAREALETQFGEPHTGIVYTPPSFSDHIAISLLLEDSALPTDLVLESDVATRKAQPHKLQKSLAACFASAANGSSVPRKSQAISRIAPPSSSSKRASAIKRSKPTKPEKKPPNTLFNHYRKLEKK